MYSQVKHSTIFTVNSCVKIEQSGHRGDDSVSQGAQHQQDNPSLTPKTHLPYGRGETTPAGCLLGSSLVIVVPTVLPGSQPQGLKSLIRTNPQL